MATQKRPILIVDGFAGPGKFGDGTPGSPLIIARAIEQARQHPRPVDAHLLAIEYKQRLHASLEKVLEAFSFARTKCASFESVLPEVISAAKTHSVFLYIDPFTPKDLTWSALDEVFAQLQRGTSVEALINFNAASFVRACLAAVKLNPPAPNPQDEDTEIIDAEDEQPLSISNLDQIAGGGWWRKTVEEKSGFCDKVAQVAEQYCEHMRKRFAEVCYHAVRALPHHTVPKYFLVFGSRHPDALRLMNDEMVRSRDTLAELAAPEQPVFFEIRPDDLVPDLAELPPAVRESTTTRNPRKNVINDVIRRHFCRFHSSQIRKTIETMLKDGELQSQTGKWRINNDVVIWRAT